MVVEDATGDVDLAAGLVDELAAEDVCRTDVEDDGGRLLLLDVVADEDVRVDVRVVGCDDVGWDGAAELEVGGALDGADEWLGGFDALLLGGAEWVDFVFAASEPPPGLWPG